MLHSIAFNCRTLVRIPLVLVAVLAALTLVSSAHADTVTTTISTGTNPIAVAVNRITNKIYVANYGSNDVTVIDGPTNSTTVVGAGAGPDAVAVNPVTNKIYVTNVNGDDVTVIDGATNSTSTVGAGVSPVDLAVNPITNEVYVANISTGDATAITEQSVQPNAFSVAIELLPNNTTTTATPTFTFVPNNAYNTSVEGVYFQVDTWQNAWTAATTSDHVTWSGTTAPLGFGLHIIYAFGTDGSEAGSIKGPKRGGPVPKSGSSPIIGQIAAYMFLVVPAAMVQLSPTSLDFGDQAVGTTSAPQPPRRLARRTVRRKA